MSGRAVPAGPVPGSVWGLDSGRVGEFMQVAVLGRCLGLPFETVRLSPGGGLPAALPGGPPPRLIISFGRVAGAALALRGRLPGHPLPGHPLLVHLGTPGQVPTAAFDLIIPMPQDDYPPAPNVMFLRLPLNGATAEATELPPRGTSTEGTVVIVGGASRHFRFSRRAVRRLVQFGQRLAGANGEAMRVVTSPRTPDAVLDWLRRLRADGNFGLHVYGDGEVPFSHYLRGGARFVVTADSASMVADACRSGAPVWLFPLPAKPNLMTFLQRSSDRCFGHGLRRALVRRGWVGGGTNYPRWHCDLARLEYIRLVCDVPEDALRWAPAGPKPDVDLAHCRARILAMLRGDAEPGIDQSDKNFHRLRPQRL